MLNIHYVFCVIGRMFFLNLYGCISRKIFLFFVLIRMVLYQVTGKIMVTLNLSSVYELDNSIMFKMPHGTI